MAIELEDEYTNATPADADYPFGSFKNAATPTSFDGTPFEKLWANDFLGLFSKILNDTGITPSGVPDTILASDYFDGLTNLFERATVFVDSGSADDYELDSARGSASNPKAYYDGQPVIFKATNDNTGASTIEIGALGAISLTFPDGTALSAKTIKSGQYYTAIYRTTGTRFELEGPVDNDIYTRFLTYNDSGTANAKQLASASGIDPTALFDGLPVLFRNDVLNTAATTIQIAALGAISLTLGDGTALSGGELEADRYYLAIYRSTGTRFELAEFGAQTLSVFTESYTSPEQTITPAGTLSLGHGLSVKPKLIQVLLICKTTELNYSVNDEVLINNHEQDPGGTGERGQAIVPDATNVVLRYASGGYRIFNKTTGVSAAITNGNWRLIIKAFA